MAHIIDTGNSTVDKLGQINIKGNIIPANWYKTILRENGKPYLLAICILSELCYWYRPKELRDERSGYVIGYQKRFSGDILQKSYQELSTLFGESKRSIKAAIDRLEEIGLLRKEFRNISYDNGAVLNNVLYIDLNAEKLIEITYEVSENSETDSTYYPTKKCNTVVQTCNSEENIDDSEQDTAIDDTESEESLLQIIGRPLTMSRETNTENTTESTTENTTKNNYDSTVCEESHHISSNQDQESVHPLSRMDMMDKMREVRKLIKRNIEYNYIISDREYYRKYLDEILSIMVETIVFEKDVSISGNLIPYQIIKSRFEKYDFSTMIYVLESLCETTTQIKNPRQYILATLYNAPSTANLNMNMKVNHDLYGN